MTITKPNPPFMNQSLSDFFDFKCTNQPKAIFMQQWIGENFVDLNCELMYGVPMFKLDKTNIFYLQYFKTKEGLELQISFGKGYLVDDKYNLYKPGAKVRKGIVIESISEEFMSKIKWYIQANIKLA